MRQADDVALHSDGSCALVSLHTLFRRDPTFLSTMPEPVPEMSLQKTNERPHKKTPYSFPACEMLSVKMACQRIIQQCVAAGNRRTRPRVH